MLIFWAVSFSCTNYLPLFEHFGYIWFLFAGLAILFCLIIPFVTIVSFIEILLFKLKILKYKKLVVNICPNVQKIIYVLATIAFIYYIWFKIYYEPILDKMLEFD